MGVDDFLDFWIWITTNTSLGWVGGSVLGLSLGMNYYLYTKLDKKDLSEKNIVNILEKLEPLLSKIINKGDRIFTKTEIDDAIMIRRMINFKKIK